MTGGDVVWTDEMREAMSGRMKTRRSKSNMVGDIVRPAVKAAEMVRNRYHRNKVRRNVDREQPCVDPRAAHLN